MSTNPQFGFPIPLAFLQRDGAEFHRPGQRAAGALGLVLLWSLVGLCLSALLATIGAGLELGQILAAAG